jgi:carbonic anhydrase/acetyltransferase-like protein (isoleucine patch superfamily)
MAIYALGDLEPRIHPDAFVHPDAVVIGDVEVGAAASVWPCAVLRGDSGRIVVGARTSIQDGSVLHTTDHDWTLVGEDAVIGHLVHLEGCRVESRSLVGNGAVVMVGAVVRSGAVIAAGAVVPGGMEVPAGSLARGVPATVKQGAANAAMIEIAAASYVERVRQYKTELRRIG